MTSIAQDEAFAVRARADTSYANVLSYGTSITDAINLLLDLTAEAPAWTAVTTTVTPADVAGAPVFAGAYSSPGTPPTPGDYVTAMQEAFAAADTAVQGDLNIRVGNWLDLFSPGYLASAAALDEMLANDVQTGDPLVEEIQAEMYTKAQNQIDAAARSAYETSMRTARGAGWEVVQPTQQAVAYRIAQSTADREIDAALDAYIKAYTIRVSYKEFCLGLQGNIRNAVQSAMIGQVQVVAAAKRFALDYGDATGKLGLGTFEGQISGFRLLLDNNIKAFEALVSENKAKLDSYRARIEMTAENNKVTLESKRLQIASQQVPYEGALQVALAGLKTDADGLMALASNLSHAMDALGNHAAAAESVMNSIVTSVENV